IVLLCSTLAGVFVQFAFQQYCATRLGIILLSGLVFWTMAGPPIFTYAAYARKRERFWFTTAAWGLAAVALNQVFVYGSIAFLMSSLYGCVDDQNTWIHNIFTNSLVVNALCYAGFVGAGLLTRTAPSPSGPTAPAAYVRELTVKHGSISTKLPLDSVYWIEADDKCIALVGEKCKHVMYRSLKSIQCELDPAQQTAPLTAYGRCLGRDGQRHPAESKPKFQASVDDVSSVASE
ncbi:MAG: hypothetical protein MUC38_11785, partial [Cyclobacteriaceae bacterium]|nr:hypothetical protein [Cyclobacteriaceae bacterium]